MTKKLLPLFPAILFILICLHFHSAPSWTVGAAFCHQISSRSPMFSSTQLPFCYRCAGLFLGIFCSSFYSVLRNEKEEPFSVQSILFLGIALILFGIDILNSTTLLEIFIYPNQTHTRFISGFVLGCAIAIFILPLYRDIFKISGKQKPAILLRFAFLLSCAVLLHAAIYSESFLILLALRAALFISSFVFLTLLYSILIKTVRMLRERSCSPENIYPAALSLSLVQIDFFSAIHLWITASGLISS